MRNLTEFCKDDFNEATIAYELPAPAFLEGDHEAVAHAVVVRGR